MYDIISYTMCIFAMLRVAGVTTVNAPRRYVRRYIMIYSPGRACSPNATSTPWRA